VARSAYVAGLDPAAGKSVVALGVAELLSSRVGRLGVFRPLVAAGTADHSAGSVDREDPVLALLRHRYGVPVPYDRLYGVTYPEAAALLADGRGDELVGRVVERYRALTDECDAVVVIGSDLDQEGLHLGLTFNADLAMEFGSVFLPVLDGRQLTPAEAANAANAARHELSERGADTVGVIVNRVPAGRLADVRAAVGAGGYAIPEVPELTRPTVAEVGAALGAKVLLGDDTALARDVHGYVVGGALVPVFIDHLVDGALVITPGDRADLIVASYTAHAAGAVSLAGIVLTLGEAPDPRAVALVERLDTGLALLLAAEDSFATVVAAGRIEPKLRADNPRKAAAALGAFEAAVDTAALADRIAVAKSTRVTPLMFEYELIERARTARRRIVLPEGGEERILRAAEVLLRRQVADLTLLGDPAAIEQRARELGLDLSAATVVDPATSPWLDEFARSYAHLRAHRAVTFDQARDRVSDVSYFGTMMVHLGYADAMVSGAVHTTAATIRPAFEIIRTVPGLSVASSVFFMCLSDRVLVYGDCAINPDPDAAQLADIAISSADTAARFGVQPRVAMLSYSTGASGIGADVDKVAAATALVRERRPDLPVEGPIQYDAAVDPAVAATKLPGSAVAGNATVLIFPDLNTGNNTYKAVQRSAHAVAVGPVLQGLRKPVNDLSRGATVRDIVNTVAITAIQAAS
jgi:phosphate acetyltransferase